MDTNQARSVFLEALNANLIDLHDTESENKVDNFLGELGYLPLAIAQAAANIREFQYSVSKYIDLYREKKAHRDLLENPIRMPGLEDQSVLITWELTLNLVRDADQNAVEIFNLLGFFHWGELMPALVRMCEPVNRLSDHAFQKALGLLVNLNFVERINESLIQVHPMVHEWITIRLDHVDLVSYAEKVLVTLETVFPIHIEKVADYSFGKFLTPHALQLIGLMEDTNLTNERSVTFLMHLSSQLVYRGFYALGSRLGRCSVEVASQAWDTTSPRMLWVRKTFSQILKLAGQSEDAENEIRSCLLALEEYRISEEERKKERDWLNFQLARVLSVQDKNFDEQERLNRELLASSMEKGLEETSAEYSNNLARFLWERGRLNEAEKLNAISIAWLAKSGCRDKAWGGYNNLHADLLNARGDKEGALRIYKEVFEDTIVNRGRFARSALVSAVSVANCLVDMELWGQLSDFIIQYAEGELYHTNLEGIRLTQWLHLLIFLGHSFEVQGFFEKAISVYQHALDGYVELEPNSVISLDQDVIDHIKYSLAVTLALGGHWEEAQKFREENLDAVRKEEAASLTLEERVAQFQSDRKLYDDAVLKFSRGEELTGSAWWNENRQAIKRAEIMYGTVEDNHERSKPLSSSKATSGRAEDKSGEESARTPNSNLVRTVVHRWDAKGKSKEVSSEG